MPLVLFVAIIALVIWVLAGLARASKAQAIAVTVSWLVAQCFMLATALHYIAARAPF